MSVALALGALGAVGAYRAVVQAGAASVREVPVASVPSRVAAPHRPTVVRWAPCKPPAVLRHGACVTERVREVVLPAAAPVVRTAYTTPAVSVRSHGGGGSSHGSGHSSAPSAGHEDHHSEDGPEHESPEPPEVETGD